MKLKLAIAGCMLMGCLSVAGAQENYFSNWPAGTSPQEVGTERRWRFGPE